MATNLAIFSPSGGSTAGSTTADQTSAILGAASSAEIVLGRYQLFALNANGDMNIRFGNVGMPAASNADFRIPSGFVATYRMTGHYDRIRIFNPNAGGITVWIQPLNTAD